MLVKDVGLDEYVISLLNDNTSYKKGQYHVVNLGEKRSFALIW